MVRNRPTVVLLIAALGGGGCGTGGLSNEVIDLAAYQDRLDAMGREVSAHLSAASSMCEMETEQHERTVSGELDRLAPAARSIDECFRAMDHDLVPSVEGLVEEMRHELSEHAATGCASSEAESEPGRHVAAMQGMIAAQTDRVSLVASMLSRGDVRCAIVAP